MGGYLEQGDVTSRHWLAGGCPWYVEEQEEASAVTGRQGRRTTPGQRDDASVGEDGRSGWTAMGVKSREKFEMFEEEEEEKTKLRHVVTAGIVARA
ncbi:uncharacterized protein GIQ15_06779 [Arthroderma uncinatum]|uniref:uncharacterized protein n=1 Tax=Arthroderma uncinatum TaxID=74035 RepID=UPI00144AC667|nr:uncharacterized protein GIQ15_06779 [Arthroderma uncinatum]KAF3479803.1 hypothetical protein GIQ15_06779 [Arthroderma uncinatum]